MNNQLPCILSLAVFASVVSSSLADRKSAETLEQRLTGTVRNMEIHPVWAPDDSALYYHKDKQILRIDPVSGNANPAIDYKALGRAVGGESPQIARFAIAENGDFICLVSTGDKYLTMRIKESRVEQVPPEKNPFALNAMPADGTIRSGANGPATSIIFINNTESPIQLFWADSGGIPQSYGTINPGACYVQQTYSGHAWIAGKLAFIASDEPALAYLGATPETPKQDHARKPDSKWETSFRGNNLFVKNRETGRETQLTTNGTADWKYCGPAIEAPDGRYLMAIREKAGDDRHIDLIEAAPKDQLQPKTLSIPYLKPGDRIPLRKPCLFDLQTMKQIPLEDTLFPNPWAVSDFHWSPDSQRLFFIYNQRGHQIVHLLVIQAKTGKVAVVAEEKSNTFIDYTNKIQIHYLDKTGEAIWMSERSGWSHLYLINLKTGKICPITAGKWMVHGIERIDEDKRELIFRAGGIIPGMDPYYIQYARVSLDGSNLTLLTDGNGTHTVSFSPKGGYYVDSWSRVDQPPIHELRRYSNGRRIMTLDKADASKLLKIDPYLPEPFSAKGRDGQTDIYGVIYRPSDVDPRKKYPVIEHIYAGPQGQFVPKAFSPYRAEQSLAELGFIVVQIDGMGTNWRSKKFHDVCWKNLKDAGFPDRMAWIKAAAKKYPYMDISRVGIYGTSSGGQNAMRAVLDHADFYKAAVADSGCHDNRMDKIWWNEQWMGWPVDDSYVRSSNVVDAHKLGGKLLLMVGALDSNVDPSSTMQVVDALIKANKDFELMVFPSAGHGAGETPYGIHLSERFFLKNLK